MITGYHRPESITEALTLIARKTPTTYPMGGGTKLNRASSEKYEVVDLQALAAKQVLDFGEIKQVGKNWKIGALVTVQQIINFDGFPDSTKIIFEKTVRSELTYNLRQLATVGGTLASVTARSGFCSVLLAMDAILEFTQNPDEKSTVPLGDYFALRHKSEPHNLILSIEIPASIQITYEAIARTETDFPLVLAAAARWPSGRTRLVLGGYGESPVLVFDGPDASGAELAAGEKYNNAEDEWASAEYRRAMVEILVGRVLKRLEEVGNE